MLKAHHPSIPVSKGKGRLTSGCISTQNQSSAYKGLLPKQYVKQHVQKEGCGF